MNIHKYKEDNVKAELDRLKELGIDYDYKLFGSKYLAKVKLTNGKFIYLCPYCKTVKYKDKTYDYKNIENWTYGNNLKIEVK